VTEDQENKPATDPSLLSDVWNNADEANVDADCSPTKVCRNAREFTFDGIADEGQDLATSWRQLLEREGKLSSESGSIRDLVLGQQND
jgi:hypothetical protein